MATQKPILSRFGMVFSAEKTVDVADKEGKNLIKKYAITNVPTIILSPETKKYHSIAKVWPQVGTIEKDGSFIFRKMETIRANYRDLKTSNLIKQTK